MAKIKINPPALDVAQLVRNTPTEMRLLFLGQELQTGEITQGSSEGPMGPPGRRRADSQTIILEEAG